ncbi:MAG: transketolase C-terminal domain-containing protein [Betaproteobacteria bacterium]
MNRQLKFSEAIREATDQAMARDPSVYIVGLGVPDPKGIFGTTLGLQEKYGATRVQDMPLSENAMTGVVLGSALAGMRPIITHQRMDFVLVAMEQMVNQAAKWHYMFGGKARAPLVVRMIVGRGWGQGPQHSQSLQAWFAHVPGLKVVMPTTAYDAKGLLGSAIEDNNPVIYIEHRWLHGISDEVPEAYYTVPLGAARVMREGSDVTIVGTSYMALEALRAAESLRQDGISAEVIDLRTIRPWDVETVLSSVRKTGRLVVTDTAGAAFGVSAEIVAVVLEREFVSIRTAPVRVALPDHPCPTSPALSNRYYPCAGHIVCEVKRMMGMDATLDAPLLAQHRKLDVPDATFKGPF